MNKTLTTLLFLGLVVLFFVGCSHSSKGPCQEIDWYEIGRQDGTKAKNDGSRRPVKIVCETSDESLAEALYNNGFDSALAVTCSAETAFELGRAGKPATQNCPSLQQEDFNTNYRRGQRMTEIEKQKKEIHQRIEHLDTRLDDKSIEIPLRGLLSGEKIELLKQQKMLDEQISSLKDNRTAAE